MGDQLVAVAAAETLFCFTLDGEEKFRHFLGITLHCVAVFNELIATGGGKDRREEVNIFNDHGVHLQTIPSDGRTWSLAFDSTGDRLAFSCHNGSVTILTLKDGVWSVSLRWDTNDGGIRALAWLSDDVLCTGSYCDIFATWDASTGSQLRNASGYGAIGCLVCPTDSKDCAYGGQSVGCVVKWEFEAKSFTKLFQPHSSRIGEMILTDDNSTLITVSADRFAVATDVASLKELWRRECGASLSSVTIVDNVVIVGRDEANVALLDLATGQIIRELFVRGAFTYVAVHRRGSMSSKFKFAD